MSIENFKEMLFAKSEKYKTMTDDEIRLVAIEMGAGHYTRLRPFSFKEAVLICSNNDPNAYFDSTKNSNFSEDEKRQLAVIYMEKGFANPFLVEWSLLPLEFVLKNKHLYTHIIAVASYNKIMDLFTEIDYTIAELITKRFGFDRNVLKRLDRDLHLDLFKAFFSTNVYFHAEFVTDEMIEYAYDTDKKFVGTFLHYFHTKLNKENQVKYFNEFPDNLKDTTLYSFYIDIFKTHQYDIMTILERLKNIHEYLDDGDVFKEVVKELNIDALYHGYSLTVHDHLLETMYDNDEE